MMNNFFHTVVSVEFPEVRIRYKEDSFLQKVRTALYPEQINTVSCSYLNIWFPSRSFVKAHSVETLNEIITHEYVHLVQHHNNRFHSLLGSMPESVGWMLLNIALLIGVSGLSLLFWLLCGVGIFLMCPIFPWYRLDKEFAAYKMSVLVRVAQWNGKFQLPKSHYDLFQVSDVMLRSTIDAIFSKTYHAQWAPKWIKEHYLSRLKVWRDEIMLRYFVERLAFEKGNTYLQYTSDIYTRTLRYFIKASARQ